jgi:predicted pyridoxine 5'-phosphate oxidase superfamily flavin-nucleotide-binding protein
MLGEHDAGSEGASMRLQSAVRTRLSVAVAATLAIVLTACAARAEISARDLQALSKSQLIFIATVRKDGNQSKAAPVWFTVSAERNAILIQTGPKTWKAKRIRRGSPVLVWIGAADGPAFIGKAEITGDAAVQKKILDDYREKYWLNRVLGVGPSRADLAAGRQVAIVITPTRDLPGGFKSAPGTPPPLTMPAAGPGKAP